MYLNTLEIYLSLMKKYLFEIDNDPRTMPQNVIMRLHSNKSVHYSPPLPASIFSTSICVRKTDYYCRGCLV